MATLRMASLGIVQWVSGRQSLFWNADWRYHATHAYSISRFGGLSDSLDYAGEPLQYHAGPSWIAGSLNNVVGLPVNWVLFFVVPIISTVLIGIASYKMLHFLGVPQRASLLAVALVMNLPGNVWMLTYRIFRRGELDALLDPEAWAFTPALMMNSLFAFAVGLVAVTLMLDLNLPIPVHLCSAVALGSLVVLKPQFFVGFYAALSIGFVVEAIHVGRVQGLWTRPVVLGVSVVLSAFLFNSLAPNPMTFSGVELDPLNELITKWLITRQTFLIFAVIVVLASMLAGRRDRFVPAALSHYSIGAVVGVVALFIALDGTTFLVSEVHIADANAIGLDYLTSSQDVNLSQSMYPAGFVLVLLATGIAMLALMRRTSWLTRLPLITVGVVLTLVAPLTVWPLFGPTGRAAYEWSEEVDLDALMREVDVTKGVWLSSDLADSAQDFARPLRAVNLTSLAPAQFYFSNGAFVGWLRADVVERVANLNRLFNTEWSSWHYSFLADNSILFVVVRDRCPPRWTLEEFPAANVIRRGEWVLLTVGRSPESLTPGSATWPSWNGGEPLYGKGDCLTGATRVSQ